MLSLAATCLPQAKPAARLFGSFPHNGRGCEEYFRIYDLLAQIHNAPGSHGLVVIYTGKGTDRLGNVEGYINGAKKWVEDFMKVEPNTIRFAAVPGGEFFAEDFWYVPPGADEPNFPPFQFDWGTFTGHFSTGCLQCEPSYPHLADFQSNFERFAKMLKANPALHGSAVVNDPSDQREVRRILFREFHLPLARFSVQRVRSKDGGESVDLYIN